MSAPTWQPNAFTGNEYNEGRPYVRRARRPPPTAEPNTGAVWESIRIRLEPQDSARMAWLSARAATPDPDEHDLPPECAACGREYERSLRHPGQRVCGSCQAKGYRSTPCVQCGGITHKRDRASVTSPTRFHGMCGKCRAEVHTREAL